ncbi:hypothetical protein AgCh_027279 [Apium graveolens]
MSGSSSALRIISIRTGNDPTELLWLDTGKQLEKTGVWEVGDDVNGCCRCFVAAYGPFAYYEQLAIMVSTKQTARKYVRLMGLLEELYAIKQEMGSGPKARTISRLELLIQVATSRLEEMPVHPNQTSQITVQTIVDELGSVVNYP